MENKTLIYDFLHKNRFMTLATSSIDAKPEAATVEYVLDGDSLLINTYTFYRKYPNLTSNPQVACVVTQDEDYTLQFEASAQELDGAESQDAKQKMIAKEPSFAGFFNDDSTRFFRLQPTWMRLRDYTHEPLRTTEYIADPHGMMHT